jgi:hypothetical protein
VLTSASLVAQESNSKYADKVKTLDSTIESLYSVISGEAGEARDWDLFKFLFAEKAWLIPSGKDTTGTVRFRHMTPEDYVINSGPWLEKNGFIEKEIHRVTDTFGNVTHVFSTYESYRSKNDTKPFTRGINSIQALNAGDRWWILNIYWTGETKTNPIPEKYLQKK